MHTLFKLFPTSSRGSSTSNNAAHLHRSASCLSGIQLMVYSCNDGWTACVSSGNIFKMIKRQNPSSTLVPSVTIFGTQQPSVAFNDHLWYPTCSMFNTPTSCSGPRAAVDKPPGLMTNHKPLMVQLEGVIYQQLCLCVTHFYCPSWMNGSTGRNKNNNHNTGD